MGEVKITLPDYKFHNSTLSSTPQAAAISYPTLHQFFAAGGILSERFANFEFRRGQLEMAESVERALSERRHLIVEAGTGTGKTLAYLLPALRSGKRVIV
ncbi:MAG: DEAD/DEAH box helicase, partial [Acidobacteriaceae bacterium]